MKERLQKILSQQGVASRRYAEQLILEKRVRLNGAVVQLGQKADPEFDLIEVDGAPIQLTHRLKQIYLLLHKPAGVVSTCKDPWGRTTVLDLLSETKQPSHRYYQIPGLHPVGRLDFDTTGALLLTNNGEFTFYLTHPRYHIPKTYQVWVQGDPPESVLQQWRQGVMLSGQRTLPAKVKVLEQRPGSTCQTCLQITLREGRNRQIRRLAEQLGYPVLHLHRTAIGPVQLQSEHKPGLPSGCYRQLSAFELNSLWNLTGTTSSNQCAN